MAISLPSYVAPNELIQSSWGNAVVDALDELDDEKLNLTGGTLSSSLTIAGTSGQLRIRPTNDQPVIDFFDGDGVTRYGVLDATASRVRLFSESDVVLQAGANEVMRGVSSAALFGKTASALASTGVEIVSTGSPSIGSIRSTIDSAGIQNAYLRHNGSASANGEAFVECYSGTTLVGALNQVSGAGIELRSPAGSVLLTSTAVTISGDLDHNGTLIGLNGATPVAQSSGWGAPTGTATKTTFATGSVTTAQLAERVKAIIDYLMLRGDFS